MGWGNEDYDFWLKVLEMGVNFQKLPDIHTFYRYKRHSMMREGDAYAREEHAMLRTRHLQLYHPAKLLREHRLIMKMSNQTRARLLRLQAKPTVSTADKAFGRFWIALSNMHHKRYEEAKTTLEELTSYDALQWQPALYFAVCLCRLRGSEASAPLLEKLAKENPQLNKTSAFKAYDVNCRESARWLRSSSPAEHA